MRNLSLAVSVFALCAGTSTEAQVKSAFTAEDMLKVATASVLDLSEDGARVAVAIRKLADNATTDHRRFGDPSYVAPSMVDVFVYETQSGRADRVFSQLSNVRQAAWSRDGSRLALLTTAEGGDGLPVTTAWVWDAAARRLSEVPRRPGAAMTANSELTWLPDGSRLIVTLRDPAEDRKAQASFKNLVDGPIVVHTSKDAFLEWDRLRRSDRMRSLAELDPRSGEVRALIPQTKLTDYQLSRDGSFVTFREDATEKTDYDVISGTNNHLKLTRAGSTKTLMDAKTLKTTNPRWSDDGTIFAYAERGEVFVQSVSDEKPRSITPKVTAGLQPRRQRPPLLRAERPRTSRVARKPNRFRRARSAATTARSCSPAARAGTSLRLQTAAASGCSRSTTRKKRTTLAPR